MLEIPGIDPQKVDIHGKDFLKLVREAHRNYEAMMQREEDRPQDPNHQNIIELSSDDELDDKNELDDLGDDESTEERSHFFQPSADVVALNARRKSFIEAKENIPDRLQSPNLHPLPLLYERSPMTIQEAVVVEVDVVTSVVDQRRTRKRLGTAWARARLLLVSGRASRQAAKVAAGDPEEGQLVGELA